MDMTPKELLAAVTSEEMLLDVMCRLHATHPKLALEVLREYREAVRSADRFVAALVGLVKKIDAELGPGSWTVVEGAGA
jgi:hypothetical protein